MEVSIVNANINQADTGLCIGSAAVLTADSLAGNTFLWSTSETSASIAVAPTVSSSYSVQVSDGIGTCSDSVTVLVSDMQLSMATQDVSCAGGSDGTVTVTPTNGLGAYSYTWNTLDSVAGLTGLPAAVYSVTVLDSLGCSASDSAVITEPGLIVLNAFVNNVLCNGDLAGSIDLTVAGGTTPYLYSWLSGQTTEDLNGLAAGTYAVQVTDINGCQDSLTATIGEPPALTVIPVVTNAPCGGATGNNGAIDLTVSGGTLAYTYVWGHGPTTEDLTLLSGGTYDVMVIDGNGCQDSLSVTVLQPSALMLSSVVVDVICYGYADGRVDLTVSGGSMPYVYSWDNGEATEDILSLLAGVYIVTVTDSNMCTAILVDTVDQPAQIMTGLISGNAAPVEFSTETYSVVQNAGSTYQWIVDGGTIQTGNGTIQISVLWGNSGLPLHQVAVYEIDDNGCIGDTVYLPVTVSFVPGFSENVILNTLTVYPNPVQHMVIVEFRQTLDHGLLVINAADGKLIYRETISDAKTIAADMSPFADGLYFLEVTDDDGGRVVRRFVVGK